MNAIWSHLAIVTTLTIGSMPSAHAWGERGHHLICQAATRLVQETNLKPFMKPRGDIMGHLCNIPDISWRSLKDPVAKTGDASHFLDPEVAGLVPAQVPTNIADYFSALKIKVGSQEKADRLGSMWWRAEEFYKLGVRNASAAAKAVPPKNSTEAQQDDLPYNQAVYNFVVNIGLMGHFVGDAGMPFHSSADYDAWETGHGGIHGFYESDCVNSYGLDLAAEVEESAAELSKRQLLSSTANIGVVDRIKEVSVQSYGEKPEAEALDRMLTPSQLIKNPNGSTSRVYGKRSDADTACPAFRKLIVKEMARSAVTLAALWDQAYREANRPQLQAYKSYKYPFTPDFVGLDYLP